MPILEFLIPRRPVTVQKQPRASYQRWKRFVAREAATAWGDRPVIRSRDLSLTLVYLCGRNPPDADNIVKPIQDALEGLVIANDNLVADVECRRRFLAGQFDVTRLPPLLLRGLLIGMECVYVRLSDTEALEDLL